MRTPIGKRILAGLVMLASATVVSACTEVLSGAAGGAAGYVIGKETAEDDE